MSLGEVEGAGRRFERAIGLREQVMIHVTIRATGGYECEPEEGVSLIVSQSGVVR